MTYTDLAKTFGSEWHALNPSDRILILRDCTEEAGVSDLAEYRRNIGSGNLFAYVKTQRIRFDRADAQRRVEWSRAVGTLLPGHERSCPAWRVNE